jgi:hypothetical protein
MEKIVKKKKLLTKNEIKFCVIFEYVFLTFYGIFRTWLTLRTEVSSTLRAAVKVTGTVTGTRVMVPILVSSTRVTSLAATRANVTTRTVSMNTLLAGNLLHFPCVAMVPNVLVPRAERTSANSGTECSSNFFFSISHHHIPLHLFTF